MKRPVFIVISGKKQHGKNFFANKVKQLLRQRGISFTETAFAAPIKKFVNDVLGIPMKDMETEEGKQKLTHIKWSDLSLDISESLLKGNWQQRNHDKYFDWVPSQEFLTVREVLQVIGTELFRERFYGPIWAEAPFRREYLISYLPTDKELDRSNVNVHYPNMTIPDVVFITDCRFPNEVEEAKKHDALLVRVVRTDPPVVGDIHTSETSLDDYEWGLTEVIEAATNDGRLDAYAENILLPKILGRLYGH